MGEGAINPNIISSLSSPQRVSSCLWRSAVVCQRRNAFFKTVPASWIKGLEPYSVSRRVEHLWSLQRNGRRCPLSCHFQWRSFPCNPRVDHYFLSEPGEDHIRSLLGWKVPCWDAMGSKLITSRPSLAKGRGNKRTHAYGEAREYMCWEMTVGRKWSKWHLCEYAHVHAHPSPRAEVYKTVSGDSSYLTRL